MIYIAVIAAMERPVGSVSGKLWQGVLLLLMIGSALQIFWVDIPDEPGYRVVQSIGRAYTAGMELQGGGVAGALLGYPLEYFFTDIGAKIIICLLDFCVFDVGDRNDHSHPVPYGLEAGGKNQGIH